MLDALSLSSYALPQGSQQFVTLLRLFFVFPASWLSCDFYFLIKKIFFSSGRFKEIYNFVFYLDFSFCLGGSDVLYDRRERNPFIAPLSGHPTALEGQWLWIVWYMDPMIVSSATPLP